METKKIICGNCGHLTERTDVSYDEVYFPRRMVYVRDQVYSLACDSCKNSNDMVIFGRNTVSGIDGFSLLQLPHVIASNEVYDTNKKLKLTETWIKCFQVSLKKKEAYITRLNELESWDKCNGNELERTAKINALKSLIN